MSVPAGADTSASWCRGHPGTPALFADFVQICPIVASGRGGSLEAQQKEQKGFFGLVFAEDAKTKTSSIATNLLFLADLTKIKKKKVWIKTS